MNPKRPKKLRRKHLKKRTPVAGGGTAVADAHLAEKKLASTKLPLRCAVCGTKLLTSYRRRRMLGLDTVCVSECRGCGSWLIIRRGTGGEVRFMNAIERAKS